jgi:hypothetical protein
MIRFFWLLFLMYGLTAKAQLIVTIAPVNVIGQKAIVPLFMTNNLAEAVVSARAVCFLLDTQGKMLGQSTKWVIGGTKDRSALQPKTGTTFNFVITSPQPFTATNFTAKVSFSSMTIEGGRRADVRQNVVVSSANNDRR